MWKQYKPGRLEICFGISAGLYAMARLSSVSILLELAALLLLICLGTAVAAKLARLASRKLLWRLRNRMVVVYLISAVIPAILTAVTVGYGARYLAGQIAVYMVHSELERRLATMEEIAQAVAEAPETRRAGMLERVQALYEAQSPGTRVVLEAGKPDPEWSPPDEWGQVRGIVVRKGLLYAWARSVAAEAKVAILVPLTRMWLAKLAPGIGEVSIVHFPDPLAPAAQRLRMRTHDEDGDAEVPVVPTAVSRFDFELLWASKMPVAIWERARVEETALLAVHSRMSAVLKILSSLKTESPVPTLLYLFGISLIVVEVVALVLGISLTRTTTEAVESLYEGTEHVMRGDFSHRVEVRGNEQVAELSRSFNRMTENLERLVAVAKEKERMEAELEIAREVQGQLFPRAVPALRSLELTAVCKPARSVSGDYYDYQSLGDGKVALAIGDVAGKGISAALLMAMLQSSLRIQVRECLENAGGNGRQAVVSTSRIMSRLNQQLFADTAPEKYATFYVGVYEDETGVLTYTNAGHLPPLLIRGGEVVRSDINGMVVGAFAHAQYDESRVQLLPGDLLVAYTDGVTEPENEYGEMFGEERLVEILLRSSRMEAGQLLEVIIDEVQSFTGSPELQDDVTLLVARRRV